MDCSKYSVLRLCRAVVSLFARAVAPTGGPRSFGLAVERSTFYAVAELLVISSSDRSRFLFVTVAKISSVTGDLKIVFKITWASQNFMCGSDVSTCAKPTFNNSYHLSASFLILCASSSSGNESPSLSQLTSLVN